MRVWGGDFKARRTDARSGVAAPFVAETVGYQERRWSNSKLGSGWAMRFQSGIGSDSSSQAGSPRASATFDASTDSPISGGGPQIFGWCSSAHFRYRPSAVTDGVLSGDRSGPLSRRQTSRRGLARDVASSQEISGGDGRCPKDIN